MAPKNKKKLNTGFVSTTPTINTVAYYHEQTQQVIPDNNQENKELIKILEENNTLKETNKESQEKLDRYENRITYVNEAIRNRSNLIEEVRSTLENLQKDNEILKQENDELKLRVAILEQEKTEREERAIIGEIAYTFERQLINKIFNERDDRFKYRLKISDIFNSEIKKSEKEAQTIEDFKDTWGTILGEGDFISIAIKHFKNFRTHDSHRDKLANLTCDYLRDVVERVFKPNSTKEYEREDALSILSLLKDIAQDGTYPLKESDVKELHSKKMNEDMEVF